MEHMFACTFDMCIKITTYLSPPSEFSHTNPLKKLRGHVRTVPGNMHVISEVRSFNRFRAISI